MTERLDKEPDCMMPSLKPACLSDRDVLWFSGIKLAADDFELARVNCGRGKMTRQPDHLAVSFGASGDGGVMGS
ncbi:hypothetical protein [Castellaniella sp.]|uniref:hypothetical protein n=1 Tax=Castellaniella sp. TaxID=1955812 RepID=UPI002AFF10A9|nr:hypothetical protein [Castellaniella sp.]